jgi:hypothetical protein
LEEFSEGGNQICIDATGAIRNGERGGCTVVFAIAPRWIKQISRYYWRRGFTVTRKSKGDYFLAFKKGSFAGLPVVTCTPFGEEAPPPICINWTTAWVAGRKTFVEIRLYSTVTGNLQDGDFEFTEFTTSTTD